METLQFRLTRERAAAIITATRAAIGTHADSPAMARYVQLGTWITHRYTLMWGVPPSNAADITGDTGPHRLTLRMDATRTLTLLEVLTDAIDRKPVAIDADAWRRLEAWVRHRYVSAWAAPPPRRDTASCSYTG